MAEPTPEALELAREIVQCTCGHARTLNWHYANCPVGDGVDLEVAGALDAAREKERRDRDELWCRVAASTLDPKRLQELMEMFNEMREDDPPPGGMMTTGLTEDEREWAKEAGRRFHERQQAAADSGTRARIRLETSRDIRDYIESRRSEAGGEDG